jgi:hypothetical protein
MPHSTYTHTHTHTHTHMHTCTHTHTHMHRHIHTHTLDLHVFKFLSLLDGLLQNLNRFGVATASKRLGNHSTNSFNALRVIHLGEKLEIVYALDREHIL